MKTVYNVSKLQIDGDGYLDVRLMRSYSNYDSAVKFAQEALDTMKAYDEYTTEDARIYFTLDLEEWKYNNFDSIGVHVASDKLYD